MARDPGRTYSADEIATRLAADLPRWTYADGFIRRTYRTHSWKGTLMVVTTVGHLAEVAWHHPDLAVSYDTVEVKLQSHDAKGITDRDFALAAKFEAVIDWQPAKDGVLEGTPQEPRHAYLRRD
ncbi:4a-hydroxytetrahydrobiopterin dehydratase [Zavarzinia sp. CC-PAN008]|uniref:4a-hydroxytetrahydrobiopterin dehydratase n=1 Tax=Zavarzinia sp. CC-PAN008 TaxID=3243332 RepID=UPI003F74A452